MAEAFARRNPTQLGPFFYCCIATFSFSWGCKWSDDSEENLYKEEDEDYYVHEESCFPVQHFSS